MGRPTLRVCDFSMFGVLNFSAKTHMRQLRRTNHNVDRRHVSVACLLNFWFDKVAHSNPNNCHENSFWVVLLCFHRSELTPRIIRSSARCSQMRKSQLPRSMHVKQQCEVCICGNCSCEKRSAISHHVNRAWVRRASEAKFYFFSSTAWTGLTTVASTNPAMKSEIHAPHAYAYTVHAYA